MRDGSRPALGFECHVAETLDPLQSQLAHLGVVFDDEHHLVLRRQRNGVCCLGHSRAGIGFGAW